MSTVQRDRSLGEGVFFAPEDYIGFMRRIVIFMVDAAVLLGVLFVLLVLSLFVFDDYSEDESRASLSLIWYSFIWFYLTVLKASRVRTVGYWVTGARILKLRGTRPSVFRMTYRFLLNFCFPFNLVYDLLWTLVDEDRQTLTDRFAGTCVVKNSAQPSGKSAIHFICYTALGFIYAYRRVSRPPLN